MRTSTGPYPVIAPVPGDAPRPFWSVMIPTYNCAAYLRHTLRSVLDQAPDAAVMQIEIVDDRSAKDDPAAVVEELGGGRVTFYRQPTNVGPQANFTSCVQRARGTWVHILHGDDMVRPGFYDAMQRGMVSAPTIQAAFCRYVEIDEQNHWLDMAPSEANTAAVIPDLVDRLAVYNHIMFPSIVVKRSAYEQVGGFHPELFHAADWDMWKRIALHFPVWYDPEPLALYRVHTLSDTSRLMQTGANIADAQHAIEIAESYLPRGRARALTRAARQYHALYAMELARQRIQRDDWTAALAQVRAGLRCSPSGRVWAKVFTLLIAVGQRSWSRKRPSSA